MDCVSLDSWALTAQALDRLATTTGISRRQSRDLDQAIGNLQCMLSKRSSKIIRQKFMTDMEDDSKQVCSMGILTAVRTFDPTRGAFSTHVHNQLRAAVGDLKHKMKPETRNIQTIAPVIHVSLGTPIAGPDSDLTVSDFLEDTNAHKSIVGSLETSLAHLQIDRAYSQFLHRAETRRFADNTPSPSALRTFRLNKLREREVFVRHVLGGETLEAISSDYKVTRERIRQIVIKVYVGDDCEKEEQKASTAKRAKAKPKPVAKEAEQPKQTKNEHGMFNKWLAMSHVSEECPTGYHAVWEEYVELAWRETGRDIRLAPTALDLSKIPTEGTPAEFHQATGILPQPADDAVAVVVEDVSDDFDVDHRNDDNVVPIFAQGELAFEMPARPSSMRRTVAKMATGMLMAATLASAAAAQTSRAIPPDELETSASRIQKADTAPKAHVRVVKDPSERTDIAVLDARKLRTPTQLFGVVVANYPSIDTLKASWPAMRTGWNMLQGLRPAGLSLPGGKVGLVFGPITQGQAEGLCHEAKRKPRDCAVTKFGLVAASKPDKPAPDRKTAHQA